MVVGRGLLCFYMSSRVPSLFLSHLCLSHYIVCFVDNKLSPPGVRGANGKALSVPGFLLLSPSLPSLSLF